MLFVCGQTSNGWYGLFIDLNFLIFSLYLFQLLYFDAGISFSTICRIFIAFPIIMFIFAFFQPMKPIVSAHLSKKESFNLDISNMTFLGMRLEFVRFILLLDLFYTPHIWILFMWVSVMGMTTYFYITTLYDNLLWLFHANRTGDPTCMLTDCFCFF